MSASAEKEAIDVVVILDESGSMRTMGDEPVQAMNAFIAKQKETGDGFLTLWKFNNEPSLVLKRIPLSEVVKFTDYTPEGMTALNDTIKVAILAQQEADPRRRVVCLIVTDGLENASRNTTVCEVRRLIDELKVGDRWKFVYLGANHDACKAGTGMGVEGQLCASFQQTPGSLLRATRAVSDSTAVYRSSGGAIPLSLVPPPRLQLEKAGT